MVLIALGAVLIDDHVVHLVLHPAQAVLLCEGDQIVADLLRVPGAVGDLADLLKIVQRPLGLHTVQNAIFHAQFLLSKYII